MEAEFSSAETGFPEPFCRYRNTTLKHPEAKSGNDAFLGFESTFEATTRRYFGQKHKHAISWGSLGTETGAPPPTSDSDLSPSLGPRRLGRARALTSISQPGSVVSSPAASYDLTDGEVSSHHRADSVESDEISAGGVEPMALKSLRRKRSIFQVLRRVKSRSRTADTQNFVFD